METSAFDFPAISAGSNTSRLLLDQAIKLTGRLAHDFGNCLTGICGFAELSMKQVPDGSLAQQYLKEVCQSAQDAAAWVQRLHLLSRGKPPCVVPADLASVVHEKAEQLRPLLRDSSFDVDIANDFPLLAIDKESLRQIIAELLDNAREALSGRGTITLTARVASPVCEAEPCADISIADTGAGLAAEVERRLGAEFFYSTKPRHHGLGLATVRAMVHAHNGQVRFGPHPEQGTTIHVFLPISTPLCSDQRPVVPIVMQTH